MEVKIRNLQRLFVQPARYEIPRFQRPYVWSRDRQWMPLWDDVRRTAERILRARRTGSPQPQPHFMGAVVLQQIPIPSGQLQRRIVVDGQQRLTTLQLLLDAAQKTLERRGIDGPAARLEDLVSNDSKYQGGNADNAFKVWPTDADQEAFRHAMDNGLSWGERPEPRIVEAHEFFKDQIDQWIGEGEDEGLERISERAEALEEALSQLFELVIIDLRSSDNAHIIFETLNARGTPLRQSDLVKNMILHEATIKGVDDKVPWPFEDQWWDRDIRQGRLNLPRIDVYLYYWLLMRALREVRATDIFSSFRRLYERGDHGTITDIANDIASVSEAYRRLEEEESGLGGAWTAFVPRWKVMKVAAVTPVLLWLLSTRTEPRQVCKAVRALDSYLVRRMVCGMTTAGYTKVFVGLLQRLEHAKAGGGDAGNTVIEFLGEREARGTLWPNDNRVLDAILNRRLYRLLTRGRLRMVLETIEEELRTPNPKVERWIPTRLTIEHIMPRSWHRDWPEPVPSNGWEDPEERRNRLLDSLGNLTLVNQPLNSALSNSPWEVKRKELRKHSTLFLNKDLLEHSGYDGWDEDAILDRARRLHEAFIRAWPHR